MRSSQKGTIGVLAIGLLLLVAVISFGVWRIVWSDDSRWGNYQFTLQATPIENGLKITLSTVEEFGCDNYAIDAKVVENDDITVELGDPSLTQDGICATALGPATFVYTITFYDGESKGLVFVHEDRDNAFDLTRNGNNVSISPGKTADIFVEKDSRSVEILSDSQIFAECYYVLGDGGEESNHNVCLEFFDALATTGKYSAAFERDRLPGTVYIESEISDDEIIEIMQKHHDSRFIMEVNKVSTGFNCESDGKCQAKQQNYYREIGSDFRYLR